MTKIAALVLCQGRYHILWGCTRGNEYRTQMSVSRYATLEGGSRIESD